MISQINIKNFKSIVDLTLDLGRVNLFIGENGSGKSNILEAVAFTTSAINDVINASLLSSKGVRINEFELYRSAFNMPIGDIEINIQIDDYLLESKFRYEEEKGWVNINNAAEHAKATIDLLVSIGRHTEDITNIVTVKKENDTFTLSIDFEKLRPDTPEKVKKKLFEEFSKERKFQEYSKSGYMADFLIYSAETSYLRKFEEEGQVKPLGTRGEGLFSLLKSLSSDNGSLQRIKEHLETIDWFEDFSIPNDLMSNEYKIRIKDRFINSDLKYLDQRSANEGFLFLLFYIVLFSSKKTPQFFAIENIEASFNPKLCAKLISMLMELAKKNEKQVLMTTHNPATLDGLDLKDDEQRLFVVRRNIDGHTIVTRISEKPKLDVPMKLSEMWTKGLLGGLPDNF